MGIVVDEALPRLLPNIKVIITPTIGLNHINLEVLKKKIIKLLSLANNKKLNLVISTI